MKKQLLKMMLCLVFGFSICAIQAQTYDFEAMDGIGNWAGVWNGTASYNGTEDAMEYLRSDVNNSLALQAETIDATTKTVLKIVYKNLSGAQQIRLLASTGVSDNNTAFAISATAGYVTKFFDLSSSTTWDDPAEAVTLQFRTGTVGSPEGSIFIKEISFLDTMPVVDGPFDLNNPDATDWIANFDSNGSGYGYDATQGAYKLVRTGGNSGITATSNLNINADTHVYLKLVYNNLSGANAVRVRPSGSNNFVWQAINEQVGGSLGVFVAEYFDLSGNTDWNGFITGLDIQLRNGYVGDATDVIYIKEIDFLTASEFATLSSEENILENNVSVYPNPVADGILNVKTLNDSKVSLYNLLGNKVLSLDTSLKHHEINVSKLTAGVYLLNINSEDKTLTKKIVIE